MLRLHATVAQLVAQRIPNAKVEGSSPFRGNSPLLVPGGQPCFFTIHINNEIRHTV